MELQRLDTCSGDVAGVYGNSGLFFKYLIRVIALMKKRANEIFSHLKKNSITWAVSYSICLPSRMVADYIIR